MGMDYYIMPNKEVECKNEFPERLSQFFEQVGGYGELAEVSQISRILDVDLSIFQDIEYESEDDTHWHSLDEYLSVVEGFITKVNEIPDFSDRVIHGAKSDGSSVANEVLRIAALPNREGVAKQWALLEKKYEKSYPPDYGFLSSGLLLEELKILKQILLCYSASGVTSARLFYR